MFIFNKTHGTVRQGWGWAGCEIVVSLMLHPTMENGGAEPVGVTGVDANTNRTNLISLILYYQEQNHYE